MRYQVNRITPRKIWHGKTNFEGDSVQTNLPNASTVKLEKEQTVDDSVVLDYQLQKQAKNKKVVIYSIIGVISLMILVILMRKLK